MLAAVISLSVLCVVFIYTTINLLRKNEELTDTILEQDDITQNAFDRFKNVLSDMRTLDSKGAFESDDEIGTVFEGIKNILTNLDSEFEDER